MLNMMMMEGLMGDVFYGLDDVRRCGDDERVYCEEDDSCYGP